MLVLQGVATPTFLQYLGFAVSIEGREYTFAARLGEGESREYKVTIANDVFESRRAKYQDGPAICFSRLRREFEKASNHPSASSFSITVAELGEREGPAKGKTRSGG